MFFNQINFKANFMKRLLFFIVMVVLLMPVHAFAAEIQWIDNQKIGAIFKDAGVEGTFVLYDPVNNTFTGYNQSRAAESFLPASTFKLPNSLIGLSTGAVNSVDDIIPYDGKPQYMKAWEKDMGLREAIRVSNVPVYQELARRIGLTKMREALAAMHYGNEQTGDKVDQFWLEGPIAISALEQARFCASLAQGTLPFDAKVQSAVREISLVEKGEGWALFGKTGAAARVKPQIGWWVGWVQKDNRIYAFALNTNLVDFEKDLPKRIELGRKALTALGLLP